MCDNPCAARFAFTFAGIGKAYFIAVMANGSAFFWFFLEFFYKFLYFLFERWEFFHQAFGLAFKNGYGFNIKAH